MSTFNVSLNGYAKQVLESMIRKGYAKTKAEALRLALYEFDQIHHLVDEENTYRIVAKSIIEDVKKGKEKTTENWIIQ